MHKDTLSKTECMLDMITPL